MNLPAGAPAAESKARLVSNFRGAMRRLAATVSVVTAVDQTRSHGMTVTAVSSLSIDPPSLLVCLNQRAWLHDIMLGARRFCVNVLRCEHADLSVAFATLPGDKRFEVGAWRREEDGLPWLSDAQAVLFCRRVGAIPYGTHTIFIGEVTRAEYSEEVAPLLYENAVYCRTVPVMGVPYLDPFEWL